MKTLALLLLVASSANAALLPSIVDSPDPVNRGAQLTYTVSAMADADATDVAIALPVAGVLLSSVPSVGGSCTGNPVVTCTWLGITSTGDSRNAVITILVPATFGATTIAATMTASAVDAPAVVASALTAVLRRRIPAP